MSVPRSIRVGTCAGRYGVYIEKLLSDGRWSYSVRRYTDEMACGGAYSTKEEAKAKALEVSAEVERRINEARAGAIALHG